MKIFNLILAMVCLTAVSACNGKLTTHKKEAFEAQELMFTTNENTPLTNLLRVESKLKTDTVFEYEILQQPLKGTVVLKQPTKGEFLYTPNLGARGADMFSYRVKAEGRTSQEKWVKITINGQNRAPTVNALSIQTNRNQAVNFTLTGQDVDGDSLTYTVVANPTHGTLSGTSPNLTYTPNSQYVGTDTVAFKASDSALESNQQLVMITVNYANALPTASSLSVTGNEDTVISGTLLATDTDGDILTYEVVSQGTKGSVTVNAATGMFTYTPLLNQNGTDSFTFRVKDAGGYSSTETVSVMITPVNDAPVAMAQSVETHISTPASVTLSGSDVDGDTLSFVITQAPLHGTLSGSGSVLTYTPSANYFGPDSFSFNAYDGALTSASSGVVSVNIKNWHLSNWAKRKKLVLNSPVASDVNNFPVMVKLNPNKVHYADFKSNGEDLRFFSSEGQVLSYEIEKWNPAGESIVWVKVPLLKGASEDGFMWLYYGNPTAMDAQNKNDVWSNGYAAVYHLNSNESSVNNLHPLNPNNITVNTTGKLGNYADFNGVDSFYSLNTFAASVFHSGYTFEVVAIPASVKAHARLFEFGNGSSTDNIILYRGNRSNDLVYTVVNGQSANGTSVQVNHSTPNAMAAGGYYGLSHDPSNQQANLYLNQSKIDTFTLAFPTNVNRSFNFLGYSPWPGDEYFHGSMDEIRISSVVRSEDWMKLTYLSLQDALMAFGEAETDTAPKNLRSYLVRIKDNNDDGIIARQYNYLTFNYYGQTMMGESGNSDVWSFLSFTLPEAISANSVENLRLRLYGVSASNWDNATQGIKVVLSNRTNPPAPASASDYPGTTITPTNDVNWTMNLKSWKTNDWNFSPNLKALGNETVTTNGALSSGSKVQFWLRRNGSFGKDSVLSFYDLAAGSGLESLMLIELK